MPDKHWYGVFIGDEDEPIAIFANETQAWQWESRLSSDGVRPVRLRLLSPLHPVPAPAEHEADPLKDWA